MIRITEKYPAKNVLPCREEVTICTASPVPKFWNIETVSGLAVYSVRNTGYFLQNHYITLQCFNFSLITQDFLEIHGISSVIWMKSWIIIHE